MLKQYLIQEEKKIIINQAMKKEIANNLFTKEKKYFSFQKLLYLLPIPALVILGIFLLKKPVEKNQPSSWLVQAQEVYKQDLVKQTNSVLHQKYIMPQGMMSGGTESTHTHWENPERIVEIWSSKDGYVNEDRESGKLVNKIIDLYDSQNNRIQSYTYSNEQLPEGIEEGVGNNFCSHEFAPESNSIYCHDLPKDNTEEIHSYQTIDSPTVDDAINSTSPQSRTEALKIILENKKAVDNGLVDGSHKFTVADNGNTVEYYFDENNFTLKKWVLKQVDGQDFIVNYLVDEYLDTTLDQIPAFNDRVNMQEQVVCQQTQAEKDNEKLIREKILNMPTGCYRLKDNELVPTDEIEYNVKEKEDNTCCVGDNCTEDNKCSESSESVTITSGLNTESNFSVVNL
jgi:hypothetical protein